MDKGTFNYVNQVKECHFNAIYYFQNQTINNNREVIRHLNVHNQLSFWYAYPCLII